MGVLPEFIDNQLEIRRVTFTAPGASILVVDDFHSNLIVAEGLLAPYKADVFTCLNGREAVELALERSFDLVLMDHMMPEMDGLEATKVIREAEGGRLRDLPIIALTANAVYGMKEMFLENGFNDYLSKPIDPAKLDAALKKWIPEILHRELPVGGDEARASSSFFESSERSAKALLAIGFSKKSTEAPLAIDGVDVSIGLARVRGSKARYLDLLEAFRHDVEAGLPILETDPNPTGVLSRPSFSLTSLITLVHALKSALANIGAVDLSRVAASIEEAGRGGDLTALEIGLPTFRSELIELVSRIAALTNKRSSGGGTPETALALEELKQALETTDIEAVDASLGRLQEMSLNGTERQAVTVISDLVLTADYNKALETLEVLLGQKEKGASG
jgi:CheY-like chemotaxis protein